jgi:hypothetical protein
MNGAPGCSPGATSALQGGNYASTIADFGHDSIAEPDGITADRISPPQGDGDAFGDLDELYDDWTIMDFR